MGGSFSSDSWYRVSDLRPRLRDHVRVSRQRFRGKAWYVVHDPATRRTHRFSPNAWWLASQLDGELAVDAAWQRAVRELGEDAPTQDQVIQLLSQLHAADLLMSEAVPIAGELLERGRRQSRSKWLAGLLNPMSVRIPLWDPDSFLGRTRGWVAPFVTSWGVVLWLLLVVPAAMLGAQHWDALTSNLSDRLLSTGNLLGVVAVFTVVKLLHELGHAYAVKLHGGEVHEAGVMLLVMAPAPYVDASASNEFRSKWYRAFVAAAGMMTELLLASIAMLVWLAAEPGVVRSIAFNVMAVAGLSTLVFNGNPLLRYDGYYILCDLIEVPNLAQRANSYYGWLVRRYAFADRDAVAPAATRSETRWFLFYAPAAFIYRVSVALAIALFVANEYFFVGVVLAIWAVAGMLVIPALKTAVFLFTSPVLARLRTRAITVSAALIVFVVLATSLVPLPSSSVGQGLVWAPEGAEVRVRGSGFVRHALVTSMAGVRSQQPLLELHDRDLTARFVQQQAKVAELEVQMVADLSDSRSRFFQAREALDREVAALHDVEQRVAELVTHAQSTGMFVRAAAEDLPGRYVKRGEILGYVLGANLRTVRAVVPQDEIGRVRGRLQSVEIQLADRLGETFIGHVVRAVPQGHEQLPSKALAIEGGGEFAIDPRDPAALQTLEKVFQFDIELADPPSDLHFGTRAFVRFRFDPEPLVTQIARRVRQLFLARLHV